MSDEESFVILGSSPMSSLEIDGLEATRQTLEPSIEFNTPNSRFSSLRNSQINDLKSARESPSQTRMHVEIQSEVIGKNNKSNESLEMAVVQKKNEEMAASKLWSTAPQAQLEENTRRLSLADCALKSPLELKTQQNSSPVEEQPKKTTRSGSSDSSLAAGFILGEINPDILKTSVYSQFPSISLDACAEDLVKLQNMMVEYSQLKSTIKKANNTMKLFYENSLQWKEKTQTMEENYKQQLNNCKQEIMELRQQIAEMGKNFQTQIEALEIAHKTDREEYVREISEKSALLENLRAQIIKLEEQQLASFDILYTNADQPQANQLPVTPTLNHELKIRELQRQLSELFSSNLDLKDMEKQYIDELNCLKVSLVAAEELVAKNRSEIIQLQTSNQAKDQQMEILNKSFQTLLATLEEQKERIEVLETQNEVHRADFEMEKQSRQTAVKEKQQMLQDLRTLQKKNQELIEEQQKLADSYHRRSLPATAFFAAPATLAPSPPPAGTSRSPNPHVCPICNKGFKELASLLCHVNDCVDKN